MDNKNFTEEKVHVELTKEEYETLKKIQEAEAERKKKPFNIYQNVKIDSKVLDFVIIGGIVAIILVIILGATL